MDAEVVRNKLDAIGRARATLARIDPLDASRLEEDGVIAAAVERLLCRMVDLAVETNTHLSGALLNRAPSDYRNSFELAHEAGALTKELVERIKPSVGLRNTIVHEYIKVDYSIVAAAVPLALETYSEYQRQLARFVLDQAKASAR
ncbi:type VII toxin-antitoxin system HepT family RNase toxin [Amycolatopsis taiwanensis]|nr:HepT-like ribonuclease domain-containing protein [Amycolatopsis taiwanensis]